MAIRSAVLPPEDVHDRNDVIGIYIDNRGVYRRTVRGDLSPVTSALLLATVTGDQNCLVCLDDGDCQRFAISDTHEDLSLSGPSVDWTTVS